MWWILLIFYIYSTIVSVFFSLVAKKRLTKVGKNEKGGGRETPGCCDLRAPIAWWHRARV